ncbi:DUF4747 family protein [Cloacibacillus porcorum]|uniref:DUF4747 family protein n=1 Tax=Cloacibacillus porcorum TaxID=1197717 RepID=UPI0023F2CA75|nr:DUF4747 family protein [Cloacibacillus porcorum]MDD7649231.1 DUF4747 family protein [Cloacibacillus porcorum]MDY4093552.1 DUF4747 family protein [Cloacibacillus porcorum]
MAPKLRKLEVAALNIKLNTPGDTARYIELMKEVVTSRFASKVYSNDYIEFKNISELQEDMPEKGLIGSIVRYTDINSDVPGYNVSSQEDCNIDWPEELKANRRIIKFIFFPEKHRLLFDTEFLPPNSAVKSCQRIFQSDDINKKFGYVAVELETSSGAISKIKAMSIKKSLTVHITLPNPDAPTKAAEKIKKRLQKANVRVAKMAESSDNPNGIIFGEEEDGWLDLSKSNGRALGKGINQGERITIDTRDHPAIYKTTINPEEDISAELERISNEALSYLVGNS